MNEFCPCRATSSPRRCAYGNEGGPCTYPPLANGWCAHHQHVGATWGAAPLPSHDAEGDFRRAVGATPGCADCAVADMACLRHALTAALTRLGSGSQSAEVRHG